MADVSAGVRRKYAIIVAIATHNTPTLADLSRLTRIPASSLKRQIAQIRTDFDMDIRFVANGQTRGRTGNYHIYDWGVLHRSEFLVRYGSNAEADA